MAVITTEGWVPNAATSRIMERVEAQKFVSDIDWAAAALRLWSGSLPDYVRSSIHGLEGGYATPFSAATWDAVVEQIFAEYTASEPAQRDSLAAAVSGQPASILDVACGTGSSTLAWHRRFPSASIVAVDVSPYMLAVAERKLEGVAEIRPANAEHLSFPDASFDCVTASLLFHELPSDVSPRVLSQMHRVLRPGGEIAVMEPYDVRGRLLHPIPFPEPYLKDYLATDWDAAFAAAGFTDVRVDPYGEGWNRVAKKA